jgi:hypothetical protein
MSFGIISMIMAGLNGLRVDPVEMKHIDFCKSLVNLSLRLMFTGFCSHFLVSWS